MNHYFAEHKEADVGQQLSLKPPRQLVRQGIDLVPSPIADAGQQATKRFFEFYDELMPSDFDEIVAHGNFEEAFGIKRGARTARALRRELLNRIYDYRSGQLHEGLEPSYEGFLAFDRGAQARRGLLADLAESAILRYAAAPRSSLVGHPALERLTASGQVHSAQCVSVRSHDIRNPGS